LLLLRKGAILLLFLLMFFSIMKNSILVGFYEINTKAFVSLFCENKSKPELKCNGKCQLSQIAKQEERNTHHNLIIQLQQEVVLYFHQPLNPFIENTFNNIKASFNLFQQHNYSFLYLSKNDKPPEFLS